MRHRISRAWLSMPLMPSDTEKDHLLLEYLAHVLHRYDCEEAPVCAAGFRIADSEGDAPACAPFSARRLMHADWEVLQHFRVIVQPIHDRLACLLNHSIVPELRGD